MLRRISVTYASQKVICDVARCESEFVTSRECRAVSVNRVCRRNDVRWAGTRRLLYLSVWVLMNGKIIRSKRELKMKN